MYVSDTKQTLIWLWIIAALVILFTLIFHNRAFAQSENLYSGLSSREKNAAREIVRKYLKGGDNIALRFKGDAEIKKDEYINGDVICLKGTLEIKGEVNGNVLALYGDVELKSNAYVEGDVISFGGKVWSDEGAVVEGDIVERGESHKSRKQRHVTYRGMKKENQPHKKRTLPKPKEGIYIDGDDDSSPVYADYNRVDGFTFGFQFPRQSWWEKHKHNFAVIGLGAYSFAGKRLQYRLGLERWFLGEYRFSLGGEFHNLTATKDDWIMGRMENSLAAFLIKEDFRDYYRREGYSVFFNQNLGRRISLRGEFRDDRFSSLENKTNWAIFGKHKKFRPNPPLMPWSLSADGSFHSYLNPFYLDLQSAVGKLTIDTRNDKKNPTRGWHISAFAERAGQGMTSDMDFERYILDIRRYQPFGWDENLNVRLRAGTATGTLPPMYWFDLGGISTLRGYDFKEFTGDRMVLGNLEYNLNTGKDNWFILDGFDLILFADAGYTWFANEETPKQLSRWPLEQEFIDQSQDIFPEDTFESLKWKNLKTDIGIALASDDGDFRINFAKRMDRDFGDSDIVVTFRLRRPF